MLRWDEVADQTLFGMTVKMYRDPYEAADTFISPLHALELDHYAYQYLDSEIFMYKILDTNFTTYIEERGDLDRISEIFVPTVEDVLKTVY